MSGATARGSLRLRPAWSAGIAPASDRPVSLRPRRLTVPYAGGAEIGYRSGHARRVERSA